MSCPTVEPQPTPQPDPAVSDTVSLVLDLFVELLLADAEPVAAARSLSGGAQSIRHGLPESSIQALKSKVLAYIKDRGLSNSRKLREILPVFLEGTATALNDSSVVGNLDEQAKATVNALASKSLINAARNPDVTASAEDVDSPDDTPEIVARITGAAVRNIEVLGISGAPAEAVQKIVIVVIVVDNDSVTDEAQIKARIESVLRTASASIEGVVASASIPDVVKGIVEGAVTALNETAIPLESVEQTVKSSIIKPILSSVLQYSSDSVDSSAVLDSISLQASIDALVERNEALSAELARLQSELASLKLSAQQEAIVEVSAPVPVQDVSLQALVGTWRLESTSPEFTYENRDEQGNLISTVKYTVSQKNTIRINEDATYSITVDTITKYPYNPEIPNAYYYYRQRGQLIVDAVNTRVRTIIHYERGSETPFTDSTTGWVELTQNNKSEFPYLLLDGRMFSADPSTNANFILKETGPVPDGSLPGSYRVDYYLANEEQPAKRMDITFTETDWTMVRSSAETIEALGSAPTQTMTGIYTVNGEAISILNPDGSAASGTPNRFRRVGDYLVLWYGTAYYTRLSF